MFTSCVQSRAMGGVDKCDVQQILFPVYITSKLFSPSVYTYKGDAFKRTYQVRAKDHCLIFLHVFIAFCIGYNNFSTPSVSTGLMRMLQVLMVAVPPFVSITNVFFFYLKRHTFFKVLKSLTNTQAHLLRLKVKGGQLKGVKKQLYLVISLHYIMYAITVIMHVGYFASQKFDLLQVLEMYVLLLGHTSNHVLINSHLCVLGNLFNLLATEVGRLDAVKRLSTLMDAHSQLCETARAFNDVFSTQMLIKMSSSNIHTFTALFGIVTALNTSMMNTWFLLTITVWILATNLEVFIMLSWYHNVDRQVYIYINSYSNILKIGSVLP